MLLIKVIELLSFYEIVAFSNVTMSCIVPQSLLGMLLSFNCEI